MALIALQLTRTGAEVQQKHSLMSPIDTEKEYGLLQRIRARNQSACTECIDLYSPGIYSLAVRLLRDEQGAEDLVQETFLQACRAIDTFEGRPEL